MPIYKDLDDDLNVASFVYDEDSVAQAVKNLLLTVPGEHVFKPTLGCDIDLQLFGLLDDVWEAQTRHLIVTCLSQEPRIIVHDVKFDPDYDRHFVRVTLTISIRGLEDKGSFNIEITP